MTKLADENTFQLVGGLWKGERDPLVRAGVIRGTNFRGDGLVDFSDVAELDVEARHVGAKRLQPLDIVVERSGGGPKQPVGRAALFLPPDDRIYFTSNFTTAIRVVDRSRFDPRFVAHYLHALYLSGATETLQRATTGIRNLDWQQYLQFEIPEYDLGHQGRIVHVLDVLRSAALTVEQQRTVLDEIYRLLHHRVLSGDVSAADLELVVLPEPKQMSSEARA